MANTQISALTAASTPLTGAEVAPIVQSGATVKVAISDILHSTADYIKGQKQNGSTNNATGAGLFSSVKTTGTAAAGFGSSVNFEHYDTSGGYAGCKVASVIPSSDANTAELVGFSRNYGYVEGWRVDIAGNVKFPQNIYVTTAAKGINFTANTPASGMTSQNLTWYEEGTWTPTVTASTPGITPPTFTSTSGTYTRIGRTVYITYNIQFNQNGTGAGYLKVVGLPFNLGQRGFGVGQEVAVVGFNTISNGIASTNYFYLTNFAGAYPGGTSYNLLGSFTYTL